MTVLYNLYYRCFILICVKIIIISVCQDCIIFTSQNYFIAMLSWRLLIKSELLDLTTLYHTGIVQS